MPPCITAIQAYDFIRTPNFYKSAAKTIVSSYQNKDTIIFQDWHTAQVTNLYLKDASHVMQKIDTTDQTLGRKIFLSRDKSGKKTLIFDFKKEEKLYIASPEN